MPSGTAACELHVAPCCTPSERARELASVPVLGITAVTSYNMKLYGDMCSMASPVCNVSRPRSQACATCPGHTSQLPAAPAAPAQDPRAQTNSRQNLLIGLCNQPPHWFAPTMQGGKFNSHPDEQVGLIPAFCPSHETCSSWALGFPLLSLPSVDTTLGTRLWNMSLPNRIRTAPPSDHSYAVLTAPSSPWTQKPVCLATLGCQRDPKRQALNPDATPFTPKRDKEQDGASPFEAVMEPKPRRHWGDLESDEPLSDSDDCLSDIDNDAASQVFDGLMKPSASTATPALKETLTRSLLIQSFSCLSQPCSSIDTTDRCSPASDESPTPLVQQAHSTTVGFSLCTVPEMALPLSEELATKESVLSSNLCNQRVSVRVEPQDGRRRGYAGLLGLVNGSGESRGTCGFAPSLEPVLAAETDGQVHSLPCMLWAFPQEVQPLSHPWWYRLAHLFAHAAYAFVVLHVGEFERMLLAQLIWQRQCR